MADAQNKDIQPEGKADSSQATEGNTWSLTPYCYNLKPAKAQKGSLPKVTTNISAMLIICPVLLSACNSLNQSSQHPREDCSYLSHFTDKVKQDQRANGRNLPKVKELGSGQLGDLTRVKTRFSS
jgi:hypothetical protein